MVGANVIVGNPTVYGGRGHRSNRLRGRIKARPTLTGLLTVEHDLLGEIDGGAQLSGALAIARSISGQIGGVVGPTGDVTWNVALHGAIDTPAALTGALTQTVTLKGTISAEPELAADLTPYVDDPLVELADFLYLFFDADHAAEITTVSGAISDWADRKAGFHVAQGTAGSRPAFTSGNFNGHDSAVFDGTNDNLIQNTGVAAAVPTGSTPGEVWALVSQDAAGNAAGTRIAVAYGNSAAAGQNRELRRFPSSNVNRAVGQGGNGTVNSTIIGSVVDFSGIHVVRLQYKSTGLTLTVDGNTPQTVAFTLGGTATSGFRLGASTTGGSLWLGKINKVLVTEPLSDLQAEGLLNYLKAIGGIA